jgi:hypothetical protein
MRSRIKIWLQEELKEKLLSKRHMIRCFTLYLKTLYQPQKFQVDFFWIVTLCSVMVRYQRFRGPYCLHLQRFRCLCCPHGTLKLWYPSTSLHGVTIQKSFICIFSAVKTSKLAFYVYFRSYLALNEYVR